MSLLRWIGVNNSTNSSSAPSGSRQLTPDTSKDQWWARSGEKYFGMENFGNTWSVNFLIDNDYASLTIFVLLQSYANSVLQALYFCKPFRELLELSASHPLYLIDSEQDQSSAASSGPSTNLTNSNHHPRISSATVRPQRLTGVPPARRRPSKSFTPSPRSSDKLKRKDNICQADPNRVGPDPIHVGLPSSGRIRSGSVQLHPSANFTTADLTSDKDSRKSEPSTSLISPSPKSSTVLSTPRTPAPSASPSLKPPVVKRNWGAADLDQGAMGSQRPPPPEAATANTVQPSTMIADPNSTIATTLRDLFHHISHQPKPIGAVAPQAFITTLKRYNELFRSTMHQDAHEFLNYLVNSVAEDVMAEQKRLWATDDASPLSHSTSPPLQTHHSSRPTEPTRTWVHQLFEGVLTNETKCLTCETVTQRDESFLDLSIDIDQNTSLTACLRQFSASEMLCQKNKFSCDQCCSLQEAEKRMKIKKLPNVLALHLKRFKYQEELQRYTKLTYRVVFPLELRLFNTTDDIPNPDRLYELWAIVIHIGTGPHHGHYVTILKSSGRWLLFDDDVVTLIEEHDIEKYYGDTPSVGSGYVLFYQAVDLDVADVIGLRPEVTEVSEPRGDRTASCITDLSEELTSADIGLSPPNLNIRDPVPPVKSNVANSQNSGTTTPDCTPYTPPKLSRTNSACALASPVSSPKPERPELVGAMSADQFVGSSAINPARRLSRQLSDPNSPATALSSPLNPDESTPQQTVGLGILHRNSNSPQSTRTRNQLLASQATTAYACYRSRHKSSQSRPTTSSGDSPSEGLDQSVYTFPTPLHNHTYPLPNISSMPSDLLISPQELDYPSMPKSSSARSSRAPLSDDLNTHRLSRHDSEWFLPSAQLNHSHSSSPSLPRKLSRKFMRRNSKRPSLASDTTSPLISSTGALSAQASTSSGLATEINRSQSPKQQLFASHSHSQSHSRSMSVTVTQRSTQSSPKPGTPHVGTPSSRNSSAHHLQLVHQHNLLATRGAQAPPATFSLTEKQQKEIKRATERATRKAQKALVKAVRGREKEERKKLGKILGDGGVNSSGKKMMMMRGGHDGSVSGNSETGGGGGVSSSSNVGWRGG